MWLQSYFFFHSKEAICCLNVKLFDMFMIVCLSAFTDEGLLTAGRADFYCIVLQDDSYWQHIVTKQILNIIKNQVYEKF